MKACVEQTFDGATAPYSGYDYTKTTLGPLIIQYNDNLGLPTDHYAGPMKMGFVRVMEASAQGVAGGYPSVVPFSDALDWVFLADISAAATTRRIFLFTFDQNTSSFSYIGSILLGYYNATHTITGFRTPRQLYTSGTIYGLTGTNTITGYLTGWSGKNLPQRTRIGFGSSTPSLVSGWYRVSGYTGTGDTTLTLTSNLTTTYDSGTPYVIDDLRLLTLTQGTPNTNAGLWMTKGIAYEDFGTGAGTYISGTSGIDGIQNLHWYKDAASSTNTTGAGMGVEPKIDWNTQYAYTVHGGAGNLLKFYKYNIRANLTVGISGAVLAPYPIATGVQSPAVLGVISSFNNGRWGTVYHGGTGISGIPSMFLTTASQVYRISTSGITTGATSMFSVGQSGFNELPLGNSGISGFTYAPTGVLSSVEISDSLDRLYVMGTGALGARSYITQMKTSGYYDHIFLIDTKQQDQAATQAAAPNLPQIPSITAGVMSVWTEGGIAYICRNINTVAGNQMYALPISVDWNYTSKTNSVLITPIISINGAKKLYRVYVNYMRDNGITPYCYPTEPFKLYYRTTGITDNTGSWIAVQQDGDLSSVGAVDAIQFKFEFQAIGQFELMSKIYSLVLTYEDGGTDSHYTPSASLSSVADRVFAYKQTSSWGSGVPALKITVTNAATSGIAFTDTTVASASGTWAYSVSGTSWLTPWNSTVVGYSGNYIKYTATTLPDGVVQAVLSL